jgi:hypothetical protein
MKTDDIKKKPTFSNEAIWDMDSNRLDVDNEKEYVVKGILENGDSSDLNELIRYYGVDQITNILNESQDLPPRVAYRARTLFGIHQRVKVAV